MQEILVSEKNGYFWGYWFSFPSRLIFFSFWLLVASGDVLNNGHTCTSIYLESNSCRGSPLSIFLSKMKTV